MKWLRMTATFGGLDNRTLVLDKGLNLIHAPNESGKSTWCAFLRTMLYGLSTKARGTLADKNRYAPWSGSPMQGVLEGDLDGELITITRRTARVNSPMGAFSATVTGTADNIDGLTAANCGEELLGIPREVFERSAFIRQSGMAIDQDAELERRIAALITTGEEGASFSQTYERLKKQLNRRRYNRSGLLPQLETVLQETAAQLADAEALARQLSEIQAQEEQLTARIAKLKAELHDHDRWEALQKQQALAAAEAAAEAAAQRAQHLRQQLEADQIPENDAIGRLRGAIVNLETVRKSVDKARTQRDAAAERLAAAEAAVNDSPFAGLSAEQAQRDAAEPPSVKVNPVPSILAGWAVWATVAAAVYFLLWAHPMTIAAAIPFGVATSAALGRRARKQAQATALTKRFGTTDTEAIKATADRYAALIAERDTLQADVNAKSATADSLYASLISNEQGILLAIRHFAPEAYDIPTADSILRGCAVRRKEAAEAETAAREAALRCEMLRQQTPAVVSEPEEFLIVPSRSREAAADELTYSQGLLATARSTADRLAGQRQAMGDSVELQSRLAELQTQHDAVQAEYDALALAMETLSAANTTLQNRFSPALGEKAANIFTKLTKGKYNKVLLNRELAASAQEAGDAIPHSYQLLSQGAADQLYLAVRLAICDMVLPPEKAIPLVLDDALTNFDDERMAAALDYLMELAQQRQVLLFTCQKREQAYLAKAYPGQYHTVNLT